MQRREFMTPLGGAVTSWRSLRTRSSVNNALECLSLELARRRELVHQLARIGYIEGSNVTYEIRGADGDINRLPQLARELTATSPDVIVGSTSPAAVVLAAATVDIPIVMTVVGDPIALGLSNSMSRPSRNGTSFTNSSVSLAPRGLSCCANLCRAGTGNVLPFSHKSTAPRKDKIAGVRPG
jgi:putative ABC transport system substrate-binding protein